MCRQVLRVYFHILTFPFSAVYHNADLAFDYAHRIYGCPRLLRLEDLQALDEGAVFTYLSLLKRLVDEGNGGVTTLAPHSAVLHSVTLVGEAAEMHSTLIGRKVVG